MNNIDNLVYNTMMPYCKVCKKCSQNLEDNLPEVDDGFDMLRPVDSSEDMLLAIIE